MIIAFLSDIHANLPALRTALGFAAERGVERVVICGDIVGDGPFPAETVELLRSQRSFAAIRGNVDRKVLRQLAHKRKKLKERVSRGATKRRNQAWTALQLSDEDREWLGHLPRMLSFRVEDQEILVVHGSPLGDTDYLHASLTEAGLENKLENYEGPRPSVLVAGHTHVPFARAVNGTLVMNCGSVGLAADGDPRGSFVIADVTPDGTRHVEVVRFSYPIDEVEKAIEERKVPGVDPSQYRKGIKA